MNFSFWMEKIGLAIISGGKLKGCSDNWDRFFVVACWLLWRWTNLGM